MVEINFLLVLGLRQVQLREMRLRFIHETAEAFLENQVRIVRRHFADSTSPFGVVIHDAGIYQDLRRVLVQAGQEGFFQRFPFPVGKYFAPQDFLRLVGDGVLVLGAGGEMVHFLIHPFPRVFRANDAASLVLADASYQKLAIKNRRRDLLTHRQERLRPAQAHRLAFGLLVGVRKNLRPRRTDRRLRRDVICFEI